MSSLPPPKLIDNFFNTNGALCLTSSSSNIPMWAHYSDNHTGYCLEYEVDYNCIQDLIGKTTKQKFQNLINGFESGHEMLPFNYNSFSFSLIKIAYKTTPPTINIWEALELRNKHPYDQAKYIIENSIGVKYKEWKYEKEFRIICNATGQKNGLCDLRKHAPFIKITGLILGCNIDKTCKRKILKKIHTWGWNTHPITVYEAKPSQTEYHINITPLVTTGSSPNNLRSKADNLIGTS